MAEKDKSHEAGQNKDDAVTMEKKRPWLNDACQTHYHESHGNRLTMFPAPFLQHRHPTS